MQGEPFCGCGESLISHQLRASIGLRRLSVPSERHFEQKLSPASCYDMSGPSIGQPLHWRNPRAEFEGNGKLLMLGRNRCPRREEQYQHYLPEQDKKLPFQQGENAGQMTVNGRLILYSTGKGGWYAESDRGSKTR
jgi:hypothetical protein